MKLQQSENQNVMLKYWEKFADGLDIAYCIKANVWRPVPKLCKYVGSSTSEQLKSIRFLLCLDIRYVNTVWNVKMRSMSEVKYVLVSMTSLLTHTVAHSTRPSFRPKPTISPLKTFLSLVVSWVKVVKNDKILIFKVIIFYVKIIQIFLKKIFIEE